MNPPADSETVLWLIRHPEPDPAMRGICYGSLDVALSPKGLEQSQSIARSLAGESVDAIYTSPSRRCFEAARCIAASHSCPVNTVAGLRELDFGDFEGRSYDEIAAKDPEFYRHWMERPTKVQFPNGESFRDVADRVIQATRELIVRHYGGQIAIVSHGGVIRIVLADVLGMPAANIFRIGQSYGAVNRVRYRGITGAVELMNATQGSY